MLTRYALGVLKVLPFTVHSAGVAVLAVSLITNYQYSDKREWSPSRPVVA